MSTQLININLFEATTEQYFDSDEEVIELKGNIEKAVTEAKDITVLTSSGVETASHYIKNFSSIEKRLELIRKNITTPLLDKKKEIDAYFKKLNLLFSKEKSRLEADILSWKRKQEEIARAKAVEERKKAEEEAINDAIKLEKELQTKAILKGEDPARIKVEIPIIPEVIPGEVKLSQRNSSGITSSKLKGFRLIPGKEHLIPREYLIPDEKKIKELRNNYSAEDKSPFEWIEFYYEESLRRG